MHKLIRLALIICSSLWFCSFPATAQDPATELEASIQGIKK